MASSLASAPAEPIGRVSAAGCACPPERVASAMPMPPATSSTATAASSRRRPYLLTRLRLASSARRPRREGARCEASSKPA